MAASPLSPPNRLDPPEKLVKRHARVATDATNTIRVPHDRFRDETSAWYFKGDGMPPVLGGNQVKYYIDAPKAFADMVAAIRTANCSEHFIYMINWHCDVDFHLLVNEPDVNLRQILAEASNRKVTIRAMFWGSPAPNASQNREAFHFLNSVKTQVTASGPILVPVKEEDRLFNSAAMWDIRGNQPMELPIPIVGPIVGPIPIVGIIPKHLGSQHQKVLCVFGEQGLVCFVGGVDFNPDRIFTDANDENSTKVEKGQPLHDVHSRVVGPAAMELVKLFKQKWDDSDFGKSVNQKQGKDGQLIIPTAPPKAGECFAQVTRTLSRDSYKFSQGEKTLGMAIGHAIRNAKRFIYTEDQYFVGGRDLENALIAALDHIEHLTVVITHWEISDLPLLNQHRKQFIGRLKAADKSGNKVRIFTLQPNGNKTEFQNGEERHTYVHSKIWIVDDEFVTIGTPNSNRRGWSHDNEVTAGYYETSTDRQLHYRLAHWLRIELWKEHLYMNTVEADAELADGVASAIHWLRRPKGARVRPYNADDKDGAGRNDIPIPIPIFSILGEVGGFEWVWNSWLDPE